MSFLRHLVATATRHRWSGAATLPSLSTPRRSVTYNCDTPPAPPPRLAPGLIVGMYEKEAVIDDPRLTTVGARFDEKTNGRLMELLTAHAITGKVGQQATFTNLGCDIPCCSVVGIGRECEGHNENEARDQDRENIRTAVATGVHRLRRQGCTHIYVDGMDYAEQAAEAAQLSLFRYEENKLPAARSAPIQLEPYEAADAAGWQLGLIKADAQNLVRRLCETPANQMTPIRFAQATVEALCPLGVNVEVRNLAWLEENKFDAFLAVARSSCEPPLMLELTYCKGMADEKPIMLLGQGLTFNSGGLCLKRAAGMQEYRANMSGAAMVVAALQAVAAQELSMKVKALVPLCENMPSGMAVRPSDVLQARNGLKVCVHDANEIGVFMLIDALIYGQQTFVPNQVVDVGTFTDEVETALSGACAAVYTSEQQLWEGIERASGLTGDRLWRMPLWEYYTEKVTRFEKFDASNYGHGLRRGNSAKAAAFMREFVTAKEWSHWDVRGTGMWSKNDIYPYCVPNVMAGRPTRTLIQYLASLSQEEQQAARTAAAKQN